MASARSHASTTTAWSTARILLLSIFLSVFPRIVAGCPEGCRIGLCTCGAIHECNESASYGDGKCEIATWFVAVMATIGGLIVICVLGCAYCCCFRNTRSKNPPPQQPVVMTVQMPPSVPTSTDIPSTGGVSVQQPAGYTATVASTTTGVPVAKVIEVPVAKVVETRL